MVGEATDPSGLRWLLFLGKGYFSGNVGIGTESPTCPLYVLTGGSTAVAGQNTSGSGSLGYLGESGKGVYGEGPTGVYGLGTNIGVEGIGASKGVYGEGDLYGVEGYSSDAIGVRGKSDGTTGVGVSAVATDAGGQAIRAAHSAGGTAVYAETTGSGIALVTKGRRRRGGILRARQDLRLRDHRSGDRTRQGLGLRRGL